MEALKDFVSAWNGNAVFWVCVGISTAVFVFAAVLRFRARINAIPATATSSLSLALVCYFVTLYGAQSEYSALYSAILILIGGVFTIAAAVINTVAITKEKRKEQAFVRDNDAMPAISEIAEEKACAVTETQMPVIDETVHEPTDNVNAAIPESALPEMSVSEVESAVTEAEEKGSMPLQEGRMLITQIAKLRALPGITFEDRKKLNSLQKRIADLYMLRTANATLT